VAVAFRLDRRAVVPRAAALPVAVPVLSVAARTLVLILRQAPAPWLEIHAVCDPYLLPLGGDSSEL